MGAQTDNSLQSRGRASNRTPKRRIVALGRIAEWLPLYLILVLLTALFVERFQSNIYFLAAVPLLAAVLSHVIYQHYKASRKKSR